MEWSRFRDQVRQVARRQRPDGEVSLRDELGSVCKEQSDRQLLQASKLFEGQFCVIYVVILHFV